MSCHRRPMVYPCMKCTITSTQGICTSSTADPLGEAWLEHRADAELILNACLLCG
jgi:hypothetical protein